MRKIKFMAFFAVGIVLASFTSCSKDSPTATPSPTVDISTGNYWPMAVNNHWTYQTNGSSTTSTISGTDTFGSIAYYKLSNPLGGNLFGVDAQEWVTKKGAVYYHKFGDVSFVQNGIDITIKAFEIPIFQDNLDVGKTWSGNTSSDVTYASQPMVMTINYTGTILEKGTTEIVNGGTYTDVIKSKLKVVITINGQTIATDESEIWFAKGVGPINDSDTLNGKTTESILTDYLIN